MRRTFVQTSIFSRRLDERGRASLLEEIEQEILQNPLAGDVVPGAGGVRKVRAADRGRGKGKRGGHRILFLDLPDKERTYLLYLYGKDESEDITREQKKQIVALVNAIKRER
jgi:hypothetical protein